MAILCVIAIHCYSGYFVNNNIYGTKTWIAVNIVNGITRWAVPMFFMISGIFNLEKSYEEKINIFFKKKLSKIILPFLIWSVIYYLNKGINEPTNVSGVDYFKSLLQQNISYHFWFMYMLINIYLIVPVLRKFMQKCEIKEIEYLWGVLFVTTTVRPFINKIVNINISAFFPLIDGYLGWYIFGYLINKIYFDKVKRVIMYIAGVIGVVMTVGGTYYFSNEQSIDTFFNMGFQINSYLVVSAVFIFFKYETKKLNQKRIVSKMAVFIGKYVYGVYLVHVLVLEKVRLYLPFSKTYQDIGYTWIITTVLSFIIIWAIHSIGYIIKKLVTNFFKRKRSDKIIKNSDSRQF